MGRAAETIPGRGEAPPVFIMQSPRRLPAAPPDGRESGEGAVLLPRDWFSSRLPSFTPGAARCGDTSPPAVPLPGLAPRSCPLGKRPHVEESAEAIQRSGALRDPGACLVVEEGVLAMPAASLGARSLSTPLREGWGGRWFVGFLLSARCAWTRVAPTPRAEAGGEDEGGSLPGLVFILHFQPLWTSVLPKRPAPRGARSCSPLFGATRRPCRSPFSIATSNSKHPSSWPRIRTGGTRSARWCSGSGTRGSRSTWTRGCGKRLGRTWARRSAPREATPWVWRSGREFSTGPVSPGGRPLVFPPWCPAQGMAGSPRREEGVPTASLAAPRRGLLFCDRG